MRMNAGRTVKQGDVHQEADGCGEMGTSLKWCTDLTVKWELLAAEERVWSIR